MGKPIGCDPALLRSASESACMDCFQRNIYQDSRSRYRKTFLQQPLFRAPPENGSAVLPAFPAANGSAALPVLPAAWGGAKHAEGVRDHSLWACPQDTGVTHNFAL